MNETKKKLETISKSNKEMEFGIIVVEAVDEGDNAYEDIASYIISTFLSCTTEEEFKLADRMLTAVTGYGINTLLSRMEGGAANE